MNELSPRSVLLQAHQEWPGIWRIIEAIRMRKNSQRPPSRRNSLARQLSNGCVNMTPQGSAGDDGRYPKDWFEQQKIEWLELYGTPIVDKA